jgi:hypothetical protein
MASTVMSLKMAAAPMSTRLASSVVGHNADLFVAVCLGGEELACFHVDTASDGVEAEAHAGGLQVGDGPMRQVAPVADPPET